MLGYDLKLNAKETKFYNFLDKDNFILDNILMFKVSYQTFLNILEYEGTINDELYKDIKDSKYALLSDTKSNIVIKVNQKKEITNLYYLDLKSDLDILELSYNFPKLDKFFTKGSKRKIVLDNKEEKMRAFLKDVVMKETDLNKLNYLLCEWNEKTSKDLTKIKNILLTKINGPIDKEFERIYNLVKQMPKKGLNA